MMSRPDCSASPSRKSRISIPSMIRSSGTRRGLHAPAKVATSRPWRRALRLGGRASPFASSLTDPPIKSAKSEFPSQKRSGAALRWLGP
jgi:hypothetical protein